jgi:formiminoglutamase
MQRSKENASQYYQAPQKKHWQGRASRSELGNQYWHQAIECIDLLDWQGNKGGETTIALLGYACDEGVRRNAGRVGAQKGPESFRKELAKLAYHHPTKKAIDFGDVICPEADLEGCQTALSERIEQLITQGTFPIVVGGGHDIAYGHYKGLRKALQNEPNAKIGILNFDAHFDLRPLTQEAHSGTPFYQILKEHDPATVEYCVLGIQKAANSPELFSIAKELNGSYFFNHECEAANFETLKEQLSHFVARNDYLYISIDMDGFSSAYAPGVSAPSPMGFTPAFLEKMLAYLFSTQKVLSCDLAELNPTYDNDQCTAKLAARIVDGVVSVPCMVS